MCWRKRPWTASRASKIRFRDSEICILSSGSSFSMLRVSKSLNIGQKRLRKWRVRSLKKLNLKFLKVFLTSMKILNTCKCVSQLVQINASGEGNVAVVLSSWITSNGCQFWTSWHQLLKDRQTEFAFSKTDHNSTLINLILFRTRALLLVSKRLTFELVDFSAAVNVQTTNST